MRKLYNLAISVVLLSVLMGISIACSRRPSEESRRPSDETIVKNIQNKVASDPETKDSQVSVVAKDGKVTLSGKAKTPSARQ